MSRIGKAPIVLPAGVKVSVANRIVKVEGPKGKLEFTHNEGVGVSADAKERHFGTVAQTFLSVQNSRTDRNVCATDVSIQTAQV